MPRSRRRPVEPAVDAATRRRDLVADGVLDIQGAAAFLACSRRRVFTLLADGRLPYVRAGRRRLIPKRALVEHLAGNLVGVTDSGLPSAESHPAHSPRIGREMRPAFLAARRFCPPRPGADG